MGVKYIKLENSFNVPKLKASLSSIVKKIPYEQNQVAFQHRVGVTAFNDGIKRGENWFYNKDIGLTDIEYCEYYEILQKEYIIECLKSLPFKPYRSKFMLLKSSFFESSCCRSQSFYSSVFYVLVISLINIIWN